ncbi:MAG: hypothetical protein JNJ77_06660 [Planctomycetia bacterium]|nr:hypothetical protein [Planctomycetia bacterium]
MDINLLGVLAICAIYGIWRVLDYRRQQLQQAAIRSRITWMLWLAANETQ